LRTPVAVDGPLVAVRSDSATCVSQSSSGWSGTRSVTSVRAPQKLHRTRLPTNDSGRFDCLPHEQRNVIDMRPPAGDGIEWDEGGSVRRFAAPSPDRNGKDGPGEERSFPGAPSTERDPH